MISWSYHLNRSLHFYIPGCIHAGLHFIWIASPSFPVDRGFICLCVCIATASLHHFCASGVFFITWYLLPFFGSWFEFGWAVRWGECPLGSASPPSHSANLVQGVNPPPGQPPLPKPNNHSVFQAKGHFCDFSGENLFCIFTQPTIRKTLF